MADPPSPESPSKAPAADSPGQDQPPPDPVARPEPRPSVYIASLEASGPNFMETALFIPQLEPRRGPKWYFFYGTLTNPDMLKHILDLEETPVLRPAVLIGYALTNWGQYKALVNGEPDQPVDGFAYSVQTKDDEAKLARYETSAYEVRACNITFKDAEEPQESRGYTFMYAGDESALKGERFDRTLWEKQMGVVLPDSWRS
ncbi:hypothetical protein Micbo1qcDRAFT_167686 [Microdochium bolleyi]|uniref:Putative gamma-glutamylcyclotransferase n=1 Tax=Microdochium bolleyi TaxID=196109 RepID=A0A136IQW4_9PEZI|nr:hypothetical protein Micbo1qcDRAFT_167686 [Microdochium bolleyi]